MVEMQGHHRSLKGLSDGGAARSYGFDSGWDRADAQAREERRVDGLLLLLVCLDVSLETGGVHGFVCALRMGAVWVVGFWRLLLLDVMLFYSPVSICLHY
jgi:hypothetical protein